MSTATQKTALHQLVMGDISRMGGMSGERFVKRVLSEVNHQLLEAGLHGVQRRFALEKFKDDLLAMYEAKSEEIQSLGAAERYQAIQPLYTEQLFDEDINDELISVWLDRMIDGTMTIPKGLPPALGQMLVKSQPEWASLHLDPGNENMDMTRNRGLFINVLSRVGLL